MAAAALLRWTFVLLHVVAAVALMGGAVLFYGVSGWGIGYSDLGEVINGFLPWLALLAVPRFVRAWRAGGARRRLAAGLLAVCAVAAAGALVVGILDARACIPYKGEGSDLEPCGIPGWAVPVTTGIVFLSRLVLAVPLLESARPTGRVAAAALFVAGSLIGMVGRGTGLGLETDMLREWMFATLAVLMGLGGAFAVLAWRDARRIRHGAPHAR